MALFADKARKKPTASKEERPRSLPANLPRNREAEPEPLAKPAPIAKLLHSSPDGPVDSVLAALIVALIGFGVVMVYSSSAVEATTRYKDPQFFLKRQGIYAMLAMVAMWIASRIDYRRLKVLTYPVLATVAGMLVFTIAGFGHRAGNADRWIAVGPVHIQPAELAKLAVVMWLSYSLSKKADQIKSFAVGFLPHLLVSGVFMLLCLKQPDFGSAVVLLFLTFTMMFVAGAKLPYIAAFTMLLGLGAAAAVRFSNYRYARYVSWIDMEAHRDGLAYQPFQSVMSFGSGGTWGLGLGRGLQVLYLPEAHTDFIFAIGGEEMGLALSLGMALLFLGFFICGVRISYRAVDSFGRLVAFGVTSMITLQAAINIGVVTGCLPTKGLPLPFVSYGGTSMLVTLLMVGVLVNIAIQAGGEKDDGSLAVVRDRVRRF